MDRTSKVNVQTKTTVGGGFGERKEVGKWQGQHAPGIKENWKAYQSSQSTSDIFNDSYNQAGIAGEYQRRNQPSPTRKVNVIYNKPKQATVSGPWGSTRQASKTERFAYKAGKKSAKPIKYLAARVRVTTANAWIGSWAMFWYLTFQMPLAVISAAGLGMAFAVQQALSSIVGENATNKLIAGAINGVDIIASTISKAVALISEILFGFTFDPVLLFITPFALVFLLGLFQLILTWFVYSAMRINSLSGKAGGIKGLMFILAGVGYAIPILNLFPLIFLWMIVVWIHPK